MSVRSFLDGRVTLYPGDCRTVLATLPEASVDSVVCDPPYGLEFMGKDWDSFKPGFKQPQIGKPDGSKFRRNRGTPVYTADGNPTCKNCGGDKYRDGERKCRCAAPDFGNPRAQQMRTYQAWCSEWAREVLRVLRPGAHLVAFSGTRTYHRMVCGIEDAGFEIRDQLAWCYGSGFPKSHDVSKAIDRAAGAERSVTGCGRAGKTAIGAATRFETGYRPQLQDNSEYTLTAPATEAAKQWEGWGTALKPAWEPIVLARKPLVGTVAQNILKWGTGALNIDGCRIGTGGDKGEWPITSRTEKRGSMAGPMSATVTDQSLGRWPANIVHDSSPEVLAAFPETGSQGHIPRTGGTKAIWGGGNEIALDVGSNNAFADSGSAARFFYTAKADSEDRLGSKHPTVKPLDLMQWLVRLVTPRGGTVLDPFAGTGTTGEAAWREGMRAILIEREPEYIADIERRMELAANPTKRAAVAKTKNQLDDPNDLPLFKQEEPA